MARGSKKKRLLLALNLSPLSSESQTPPTPSSPADTTAISTSGVGHQPIPSLSVVSGLDLNNDPPQSPIPSQKRLSKDKVPEGFVLLFGKLHPKPSILKSPMPPPKTDTTARSIRLVADHAIPAASAVNGPRDNDNPSQPPASGPNAPMRPLRNSTVFDPNSIGVSENSTGLYESTLWLPGVRIPGCFNLGLEIDLGKYRTKQEAQDVHDRAALKLFEAKGVPPLLNSPKSRHAKFMEEYKDWDLRDFLWQFRRCSVCFSSGSSSMMKGVSVFKRAKGNLFQARTAYTRWQEGGKVQYYYLGQFASEEDAGKTYGRGMLFLRREETEVQKLNVTTNFRPSTYSGPEILKAGKDFKMKKPILPGSLE